MRFHHLINGMLWNSDCNLEHPAHDKKIKLLKRAKKVLTSPRLKKEYDRKRSNNIKSAFSKELSGKSDRTSFDEWIDSCALVRRSDSDSSSDESSSLQNTSEKFILVLSESDGKSLAQSVRECETSNKINHDNEVEKLAKDRKKLEKSEIKTKVEFKINIINDRVFKKPQPTSNSSQDQQRESLSKKRNLSNSNSSSVSSLCVENVSKLKSTEKIKSKKMKKNKKKRHSIMERVFQ